MTQPLKDNAHILAERQAFQEACARARQAFAQIENVVGVGMGLKQTGGEFKDDIAIIVFVSEKKNDEDLPPVQRIPRAFEGYRTDVRVVADVRPGGCDNKAKYDTIQGGIQITTKVTTTPSGTGFGPGTLGCIVRKRNDAGRENVYILSNKHVLQSTGSGVDDYVYHPFPPTVEHNTLSLGPVMPGGAFANVPHVFSATQSPVPVFIDCAIARLDIDSKCCGSTCTKDTTKYAETIVDLEVNHLNTMSDVNDIIGDPGFIGKRVSKVGRTSGKTDGKITAVAATFPSAGDPTVAGPTPFMVQTALEIAFDRGPSGTGLNCHGRAWFAEEGDSGSIVVDEQNRVVGIISHVPDSGSAPPLASSYACHIVPILDWLGICIPCTTGTSHGSTRATDGSGLAPATSGSSSGDFPMPDGIIVFAEEEASGASMTARGVAATTVAMELTDQELALMHERLEAFRATRNGRELHDVFAEVRREVGYLIRNSRPVTVAWHRHKGPAFLAHVLNHLAGHTDRIPQEVQGVTRRALLVRMREVLAAHGSNPLRAALARHGDGLLAMASSGDCNTIEDGIAFLREREPA